ncbi:hypothetical protein ACIRBX_02330 [Kitasatospora sp. NPDC096147]|uniref:hypothetical protein n=1 Tax=Kitasatospora sp. NPDC096147 TaxID=3364093 RepID=UPI0038103449
MKKLRLMIALFAVLLGVFGGAGTANAAGSGYVDIETASAPGWYDGTSACTTYFPAGAASRQLLCASQYTVVTWTDGRKEISGLGADRAVWTTIQTTAGGAWGPWVSLGGANLNLQYGVAWPNRHTIGSWSGSTLYCLYSDHGSRASWWSTNC